MAKRTRFPRRLCMQPQPCAPTLDIPKGVPIRDPDDFTAFTMDAGGNYSGPPIRSFDTKPPRTYTPYRDSFVDTDSFLAIFPEFGNTELFSRAMIEGCAKRSWFYCTKYAQCDQLDGDDRKYAQDLMTAHLIIMTYRQRAVVSNPLSTVTGLPPGTQMISGGMSATGQMGTTGIVTSASIGGESVSLTLPQSANAWEFWLNQTLYGIELQAFLSSHVPIGIYSQGDDFRMCLRD